jgi:hypothetical protein
MSRSRSPADTPDDSGHGDAGGGGHSRRSGDRGVRVRVALLELSDDEQRQVFGKLDNGPVIQTDMRLGIELSISYGTVRDHARQREIDVQMTAVTLSRAPDGTYTRKTVSPQSSSDSAKPCTDRVARHQRTVESPSGKRLPLQSLIMADDTGM